MPFTVVVDGVIGAGKTTYVAMLRKTLAAGGISSAVVAEPVDAWRDAGVLQEFYDTPEPDRRDIAYIFQTYTFVTRITEAVATVEANPAVDVYICERSVWTDREIFMKRMQRDVVGADRMAMYDSWWTMWARLMPAGCCAPGETLAVFLKPSVEACAARIAARARPGETVSAAYLEALHAAHVAFLETPQADATPQPPWSDRPVVVIDGAAADADFTASGEAADRVLAPVCAAIAEGLRR